MNNRYFLLMKKLRKIVFPARLRLIVWVMERIRKSADNQRSQNLNTALLALSWGNLGYAGNFVFLRNITHRVNSSSGYVLECGSGVTTLLIAAITKKYKTPFIVLEHNKEWLAYLEAIFRKLNYPHVILVHSPLHDYGGYTWYKPDEFLLPGKSIKLVICDGPPGSTPGGRFGLMPVFGDYLADDCIVLLDDTHRVDEQNIIQSWKQFRDIKTRELGVFTKHTEITFI